MTTKLVSPLCELFGRPDPPLDASVTDAIARQLSKASDSKGLHILRTLLAASHICFAVSQEMLACKSAVEVETDKDRP